MTVPYLMGQSVALDFSPFTNALAQYRDQRNRDAQRALQERQLNEGVRQFDMQNSLARDRFGLDQRAAGRADQMAPLQLQLLKAQTQSAGAEAGMTPLRMEQLRAQTELARAQALAAGNKSETDQAVGGLIRGMIQPQQAPQSPVRPQSFNSLAPQDPMFVQTQAAEAAPMPRAVPGDVVNTPAGPMTPEQARRMGFALGLAGKGDAGKMLIESADQAKLGKEARNKVDELELQAVNSLGRLKEIARGYDDEFLTIEGRLKQYGMSWLDSFDSMRRRMKPEDVEKLARFTSFQRDAFENLTQGIKDATGAAMGIQEEARIRKGLPDPDKDSPTQFKSKLDGATRSLEMAIQRTQFLRQNGFRGDANAAAARMPLPRFEQLLKDSRGLYQQLRSQNPTADDGALRDEVRRQINAKYRVDA